MGNKHWLIASCILEKQNPLKTESIKSTQGYTVCIILLIGHTSPKHLKFRLKKIPAALATSLTCSKVCSMMQAAGSCRNLHCEGVCPLPFSEYLALQWLTVLGSQAEHHCKWSNGVQPSPSSSSTEKKSYFIDCTAYNTICE